MVSTRNRRSCLSLVEYAWLFCISKSSFFFKHFVKIHCFLKSHCLERILACHRPAIRSPDTLISCKLFYKSFKRTRRMKLERLLCNRKAVYFDVTSTWYSEMVLETPLYQHHSWLLQPNIGVVMKIVLIQWVLNNSIMAKTFKFST